MLLLFTLCFKLLNKNIRLFLFLTILLIANLESFLLLRHKSPFISDSFFYRHIVYQYLGNDYNQARNRVIETLPAKLDQISSNFFYNDSNYRKALKHFTKRPFYPWLVGITYRFTNQEYLSFLLPQLLALNIVLIASIYLFRQGLTVAGAIISTALLAAFPPVIEWTTYFTGDIIGASFWLLQIALLFKLIQKPKETNTKIIFMAVLILSLLNREQSLLMNLVVPILYLSIKSQPTKRILATVWKLTVLISIIYLSVLKLTEQYTILDTISYLRNNYGLSENVYTFSQNIPFILQSIVYAHQSFLMDLIHHRWWLAITLTGIIGAVFAMKRPKIIDAVMLASAIGSYAAIFIYPSFGYKYFFPIVISLIYFSIKLIRYNHSYRDVPPQRTLQIPRTVVGPDRQRT